MLFVVAALGCDDEPDAAAPPPPVASFRAPSPRTDLAESSRVRALPVIEVDEPDASRGERALSHPAAFDLVGTPPGATLIWATDDTVRALRLSRSGEPERAVVVARVNGVAEISAAATTERVAAIWIAGDATLGTAESVLPELAFGKARPIGRTESLESAGRGRLHASATGSGSLMALARTGDEPCERYDEASCANFTMLDLVERRAQRRPGLEVPHPCARPIAGFAVAGLHWHYAVCHHDGPATKTVLFTAQQTPSYAQTQELLTGCKPRGITRRGDDIWLSGSCGGEPRAVHVRQLDVTLGTTTTGADVACDDDELILLLSGERTALKADTIGLGALMPSHLVADDARAVWTGETLIVARPVGERLVIDRHVCRAGALQRSAR